MSFDIKAFGRAQFEHPTEVANVPELSQWFGDSEPAWTLRGLTHAEWVNAMDVHKRDPAVDSAIAALAGDQSEVAKIFKELLGRTDGLAKDTKDRIEYLIAGSVNPKVDRPTAIKLATFYPLVFAQLTNIILSLTTHGPSIKKKP